MGYRHIDNLYANTRILLEPEVWATEKIHGTSAHVGWQWGSGLSFFSGEQAEEFRKLFDAEKLEKAFEWLPGKPAHVVVYGECCGGKVQRQAWRYGTDLCFVAFEVLVDGRWLSVPEAAEFVALLGLEFVPFDRVETKLILLDALRDAPSEFAKRRGVRPTETTPPDQRAGDGFRREGIVLRCIDEKVDERSNRILAKHKRAEERETKTKRRVDPERAQRLLAASAVADEFVTETRLDHVLQALSLSERALTPTDIGPIVREMVADVSREGAGEFEPSAEANRAIGTAAALLVKRRIAAGFAEAAAALGAAKRAEKEGDVS